MAGLDAYYLSQEEPNKSCLLALRDLILQQDVVVRETRKYGMPCFCFRHKMFCYLWVNKQTYKPYVLFVEGRYLEHPMLEKGKRSRMKVLNIDPTSDLPIRTIKVLLRSALDLYRKGILKIR